MISSLNDDDTEGLLDITEAVAKLNSSFRNNDKLSQPKTEQEEVNAAVRSKFSSRLKEAQIVDGD